ncbi:MAG: toll/interleukin-1 receptor domain-containing protein [Pyrinomonadaceae bacterium]
MPVTPPPEHPVELFYSYSHKDEKLRSRLESHLHGLKRQGFISGWHDRRIVAGTDWARELDMRLETAGVILLLISADYIESDYCYGVEMKRALERYEAGAARVIPVLLRPCAWQSAPFGKLQALPTNIQPVTEWKNRDKAFLDIVEGVRRAVEEMHAARGADAVTPTCSDAAETGEHGRWVIVISATVDEINLDKVKAIEAHLRKLAEDTELTVMRVERGSVVLVLEGTRRGFERVSELLESGRLDDLLGYEVKEVRWGFDEQRPAGVPAGDQAALYEVVEGLRLNLQIHHSMLKRIEPNFERTAEKYSDIRRWLASVLSRYGPSDPQKLVDELFDRLALNTSLPNPESDDLFSHTLARLLTRSAGRASRQAPWSHVEVGAMIDTGFAEILLLERYMRALPPEGRGLLADYYAGRGRERQEARKRLAQQMNISTGALRTRVYRAKTQVLKRMRKVRARHVRRGGQKKK